ncbi:MAG: hypothetical protein QOF20_588 [Acidimicrobiaceae bacterium]|nr:hypothetical protein [Acidimicrobiaceae bacterium]MDQ1365279.1 hypothetical protein [Acidimicrobiaceae bacterium]MDQ1368235.1 hypothetical protein [Acidimicrobiaceae bacterium]MDQ1412433.1 hypothetical protein [Acidimicrobiaceae bacterium]MDQ1420575.1 hypothetical protein [Acidimicrobiaceae bacterium]
MIGLLVIIVLAVVAIVGWFKLRRHGQSDRPAANWLPTEESFRDPSSGQVMRVWLDPDDGSRHYVPEITRP